MMREICCNALQGSEHYAKNDVLFRTGREAVRVLCLTLGTLVYCVWPTGMKWARKVKIDEGTWCVEASLWMKWQHVGKMTALSEVNVAAIVSAKFRDICRDYPDVFPVVQGYAFDFWQEVQENWRGFLTDLGFANMKKIVKRA